MSALILCTVSEIILHRLCRINACDAHKKSLKTGVSAQLTPFYSNLSKTANLVRRIYMPIYNIDFSEATIFQTVNYSRVSHVILFLTLQSYHSNARFLSKFLSISCHKPRTQRPSADTEPNRTISILFDNTSISLEAPKFCTHF